MKKVILWTCLTWIACGTSSQVPPAPEQCLGPDDFCGAGCRCVPDPSGGGSWRCECEVFFPQDVREVPLPEDPGVQDSTRDLGDLIVADRPSGDRIEEALLDAGAEKEEDFLEEDPFEGPEDQGPPDPGGPDPIPDAFDDHPEDEGDAGIRDPGEDRQEDLAATEDACLRCPDAGPEVCESCGGPDIVFPDVGFLDLPPEDTFVPLCLSDEECRDEDPCTVDRCDPTTGCHQDLTEGIPCELSCGALGFCTATGDCVGRELCNGRDDDCDGLTDEDLGQTTCGIGACQRTVDNCADGRRQECRPGVPEPELCNGMDDDCDGLTDEDLGQTTCGIGLCERTVENCVDGYPRECQPGAPEEEVCNGMDDDCDGLTDEDLGQTTCGTGLCERTVENCADGRFQPCIPGAPGEEVCNGMDDDCDGLTDEDLGVLVCGTGICLVVVEACVDGQPQTCVPGSPSMEVCNGSDDDCDGLTDEDLGQTTCGIGACQRTVDNCAEGHPQECQPGAPTEEVCNDQDDDCNGGTDEPWPDKGSFCIAGIGSCARGGDQVCRPDGMGLQCGARPADPQEEVCNRIDDDCDGLTDEDGATLCDDAISCTIDACVTGECVHGLAPNFCLLDGACVPAEGRNPTNECLACIPQQDQTAWSPRIGGLCDDGDACTQMDLCDASGRCLGSPLACAQPNPSCGGDGCYCDATARTRCLDDGVFCTLEVCLDGLCTHPLRDGWCFIDSSCVPEGTRHPANDCLVCRQAVSRTAWTIRNGQPCDDQDPCTSAEACNADGQCIPSAGWTCSQPNPFCGGDGCYCDPLARVRCEDDGLACTDEACLDGHCIFPVKEAQCLIDGICRFEGDVNPANVCLSCQSSLTRTDWSPRPGIICDDGDLCTRTDTCNAMGLCVGTPLTCSQPNPHCGGDDCYCNPTTKKKCNDGLACTVDFCNSSQNCTISSILSGWCAIAGACYTAGQTNPWDYCQVCNPSFSQTMWYNDPSCY